jgi:glycosyltransferase 2 family protein
MCASPAGLGDNHDPIATSSEDALPGRAPADPTPRAAPDAVGDAAVMDLRPARRERSPADVLRLLLGLVLLGAGLLAATLARNTVVGVEADIVEAYERLPDRLAEVLTAIAFVLAAALPPPSRPRSDPARVRPAPPAGRWRPAVRGAAR